MPKKEKLPVKFAATREFINGFSHGKDETIDECLDALVKAGVGVIPKEEKMAKVMQEINSIAPWEYLSDQSKNIWRKRAKAIRSLWL